METKLTLKDKNLITLKLKQVKLMLETNNPKLSFVFVEDIMLKALAKTELAKDKVAMAYAKNEVEKMFA